MGTVYRKSFTKPLPAGAEIITRRGERLARWRDARGKVRTAAVTTGRDGTDRILTTAGTWTAKYRDGQGIVREVATGCRDKQAALSILADLERRAERVRGKILTPQEAEAIDFQETPISRHFADYVATLEAKGCSPVRIRNMQAQFNRVCGDCRFLRLCDLDGERLTRWLLDRMREGMSAATRNGYRETLVMFANWCVRQSRPRLLANPFTGVPKADANSDPRRQRRAMTEDELRRLLIVATLRPLAEYGRETVRKPVGERKGRSTWTKAELTFDGIEAAAKRGRERLRNSPALIDALEAAGRERALIYKTLVLIGLRKGELASITVGQCHLDGTLPYLDLYAADEKNRQGSRIPLRDDLAAELREWLRDRDRFILSHAGRSQRQLFDVPAGLVRILNRDLKAAGIPKVDERGRTIDVHALRHTFGTLLSKGGVAPRTAQAAMRHSTIDLTMNVYTDLKLLDVAGALDALPDLSLAIPATSASAKATGTDGDPARSPLAPTLAPNLVQAGQSGAIAVKGSKMADERQRRHPGSTSAMPVKRNDPLSIAGNGSSSVGVIGLEQIAKTPGNRRFPKPAALNPAHSLHVLPTWQPSKVSTRPPWQLSCPLSPMTSAAWSLRLCLWRP